MKSVKRRTVGRPLDLRRLYPDLFIGLDGETTETISEIFVSAYFEGWKPNREDVADLIAWEEGEIDDEEYDRRGAARAVRARCGVGS